MNRAEHLFLGVKFHLFVNSSKYAWQLYMSLVIDGGAHKYMVSRQ